MTLSTETKCAYIAALKKVDRDQLRRSLIKAALNKQMFPDPIREKMDLLQSAFAQHDNNAIVKRPIKLAITAYVTTEVLDQFNILLSNDFKDETWNSALLSFLAKELAIEIEHKPIVQATIKDGKIYWRILKGDTVIYDRHSGKNADILFTDETSWRMDWKLFRTFKDSGKRSSPVEITRERFISMTNDPKFHTSVGLIWDNLKETGILNARNRLSRHWRALSNQVVQLPAIENIPCATANEAKTQRTAWYNWITSAFNAIANNEQLAENIPAIPTGKIFRSDRSPKSWYGTGRINNRDPKADANCAQIWDVAAYSELNHHRSSPTETKKYGKILNYDHNPATSALKGRLAQVIGATRDETLDAAFAIAIPQDLHRQGETYLISSGTQSDTHENVFYRDIKCYLDKLEVKSEDYALKTPDDYIKALGAFRFLYRTECKTPEPAITNKVPLGRVSHTFFKDAETRKKLDAMFLEKIKSFVNKREGQTTLPCA